MLLLNKNAFTYSFLVLRILMPRALLSNRHPTWSLYHGDQLLVWNIPATSFLLLSPPRLRQLSTSNQEVLIGVVLTKGFLLKSPSFFLYIFTVGTNTDNQILVHLCSFPIVYHCPYFIEIIYSGIYSDNSFQCLSWARQQHQA